LVDVVFSEASVEFVEELGVSHVHADPKLAPPEIQG
jgi:hypothetical protein